MDEAGTTPAGTPKKKGVDFWMIAAIVAIVAIVIAHLGAIASIGSAVALTIFSLVTLAHLRVRRETGARLVPLVIGLLTTTVTLLVFATTTLVNEPAATTALAVIILLSIGLDLWWKRARGARGPGAEVVPLEGGS